jgi:hypothetical protein
LIGRGWRRRRRRVSRGCARVSSGGGGRLSSVHSSVAVVGAGEAEPDAMLLGCSSLTSWVRRLVACVGYAFLTLPHPGCFGVVLIDAREFDFEC